MTKRRFAMIAMMLTCFAHSLLADRSDLNSQSLEVAETIINLAPGLSRDLNPPVTGADRIVTHATVTWEGNAHIYNIEGKDVLPNGRITHNYRIRLEKHVATRNLGPTITEALEPEAHWLIGALLNGLYDIAQLNLDHRVVDLNRATELISETNGDVLTYELVGINRVCEHDDQNSFQILITRTIEHNRPFYDVQLIKPYAELPIIEVPALN